MQRWVERAALQAQAADQELVDEVQAEAVELDKLYSFAGVKRPVAEDDPEVVGQPWAHVATARESRLRLEVVVAPTNRRSYLIHGCVTGKWSNSARAAALWQCPSASFTGRAELISLTHIATSLLERLNGTLRQHIPALHCKARSFAKCRTALDTHTQLFKSYYNLCLRHSSGERSDARTSGRFD